MDLFMRGEVVYFNTSRVRLEAQPPERVGHLQREFQYLKGAIRGQRA